MKTRFPKEKHGGESGTCQQVKLLITVATRANSPRFQSFANENENLSEFGSQSNTNSESTKSMVFRIGTDQIHR